MPNAIRMTADGYARLMAKARASRIHSSPIAPAVHAGPPETATARSVRGTGNRAPETDGRATGPESGHSARLRRDVRGYGEGGGLGTPGGLTPRLCPWGEIRKTFFVPKVGFEP